MKKSKLYYWLELVIGVFLVILGILTFRSPGTALSGLVIAYGVAAIISGVSDIILYVKLERRTGFGPVSALVGGILSVLLGVLLMLNIQIGAIVMTALFPIWFIIHCISRLSNLDMVKYFGGKAAYWISLVVNILGLILGFMLILNPLASMMSMSYLIGLYLLVLGIGSVITALSGILRR